ncbi:Creatinase/aminopeptidase [Basidiobolus meristosporus CBS 931.73]|uniref:Xaa-Pro aminopeptidase n=1 Tax=Basidiobolus meristosporus CBS 931.73 TaxID=1314790 RepID=A0A1Y1XXN6_9FUNG|nr:Creatinase/aminopeptidase [Basidiobolus meristosporus CBS 931.73]|eukprot:ORX90124.1 Creatinase/aminopeptidase [Basidiobolus meristosporus CBS 931.73]
MRFLLKSCFPNLSTARGVKASRFERPYSIHVSSINTTERLIALRALMAKEEYNLQAYVIPSEDAHQSEYTAECDNRRPYISGFTGSAGCAVVSNNAAALFTDGRYFIQASQQLDSNWTLMKQGLPNVPTWQEYVTNNLPAGSRIGIDPKLITAPVARKLQERLTSVNSALVTVKDNLIDKIWKDRPSLPANKIFPHPMRYAGRSVDDKLLQLREELRKYNAYGFIVSTLDEIAWLFNLRGSDIQCNPVFFSYALVTGNEATLYVSEEKLTEEVKSHLGMNVKTRPYDAIWEELKKASIQAEVNQKKFLISNKASFALYDTIGAERAHELRSPIGDAKSIKNETELAGMRQCHLRDAAALVSYFAWLEDELVNQGNSNISEADGADKLEQYRREQENFFDISFDTISSTGPNGAIIHYKPEKATCSMIDKNQMYLCDSGAQYRDGTTDVTRTLHFTNPTEYERECYTRVLKGHIAIDTLVFPKGTTGYQIDAFSRSSLWKAGLDFRHGTGHGVGSFLNVHEGPQSIATRASANEVGLSNGMLVTNEPGYYEDGKFGIRIENILLVREENTPYRFGDSSYLGFEHITFVPLMRKLIQTSLLNSEEIKWVNDYHSLTRSKIAPLLKNNQLAYDWLIRETAPL